MTNDELRSKILILIISALLEVSGTNSGPFRQYFDESPEFVPSRQSPMRSYQTRHLQPRILSPRIFDDRH